MPVGVKRWPAGFEDAPVLLARRLAQEGAEVCPLNTTDSPKSAALRRKLAVAIKMDILCGNITWKQILRGATGSRSPMARRLAIYYGIVSPTEWPADAAEVEW